MNAFTRMRNLNLLLALAMILSLLFPYGGKATAAGEPNGGGGASASVTDAVYLLAADGYELTVNYVNFNVDAPPQKSNYVALFTSGASVTNSTYADKVFVKQYNAAIQVNAHDVVTQVVGRDPNGNWPASTLVDIPPGGYVLLASDPSWATSNYRKPLLEHYTLGGTVGLYRNGAKVSASDFIQPTLIVAAPSGTKTETASFPVEGRVLHYTADANLRVTVGGAEAAISPDGSFSKVVTLAEGLNPIKIELLKNQTKLDEKTISISYKNPDKPHIQVEAAPDDISIDVQGEMKDIDYIDTDITGISDIIALFTREYSDTIAVPQYNVAVQVDQNNRVLKVVNPAVGNNPPSWVGDPALAIPEGGYVLMAQDDSYANKYFKRYLATKFKVGDLIKLRKDGVVVPVTELMSGKGPQARLTVTNFPMYTVTSSTENIAGKITNAADYSALTLKINGTAAAIAADGTFNHPLPLTEGVNYVDIRVSKGSEEHDAKQLIIYSRPDFSSEKKVILWVDQAANARKFQTEQSVKDYLLQAKDAGITTIAFDVKGVEGYVSYKKNDLTNRPYASAITAPGKAGVNPNLDLLELFTRYAHELGLDIHAAFNTFAEGSIASNEYALLNEHPDWEEHVLQTDNQIKRLRESNKQGLVAFVNPHNDEVVQFQLKTMEEVMKNYDIDGVILDRTRFDNESADFSDLTKGKFAQYLAARGKTLNKWPDDVYKYVNGVRVNGPLIADWWAFRSATIKDFVVKTRELADRYAAVKNRKIEVSAYVGSWFESYYLNGVHWGSTEFRYDERLGLPDGYVYTDDYYETGYIQQLDFLMIGAYQTTRQEIEKYITLGNIVTRTERPMYAGIAMNNVQDPDLQRLVFQAGLETTHGLMLFDASQVNWDVAKAALRNEPYVKDYQVGVSLPKTPDQFLEANFHNVNLVEGNINVITESFGYSTGAGRYAVEAVVDASGKVTRMPNRTNAVNWSWTVPEDTNSVIPPGGFVVTSLDPSGTRTRRQLVANSFNIGDEVRASKLKGMLANEGKTVSTPYAAVTGSVEVLGPGKAEVTVNGSQAPISGNGSFAVDVPLQIGDNTVTVEVYVDGYLTNRKSFTMKRTGGDSGVYVPAVPKLVNTETVTAPDGRRQVNARFDSAELTREIERAFGSQTGGGATVTLTVPDNAPIVSVHLPADSLRKAAGLSENGSIRLVSQIGSVTLPIPLLGESLAEGASEVIVVMDAMSDDSSAALFRLADTDADAKWIGAPMRYSLTVAGASGAQALDLGNAYVERSFTLPAPVDPSTSTIVRFDPATGEYRFVPSRFVKGEDGSTTAYVYDASSDGTYAVLTDPEDYADVEGHWAAPVVNTLASKQLIEGVAEDEFAPDQPLTRAELAALLVRSLALKLPRGGAGFADVGASDWFSSAVAAAAQAGLIEGFEDGTFRPDERVTREQMSVMLIRALEFAGIRLEAGSGETFADGDAISPWAADAVAAAAAAGLLQGRDEGKFEPSAYTTRAEGATILKRLLTAAGWLD